MEENYSDAINDIIKYLQKLDSRMARIESHLELSQNEEETKPPSALPDNFSEKADSLELHIGQYWFAKVGIVSIIFGMAFLLMQPYGSLPEFFPSLIGYILAGVLFLLSRYWKNSYTLISQYLFGAALILLYFSTMRLHFFEANQAVPDKNIVLVLLSVVTIIHLYISHRRESVYLTGIGLTLGYLTAILSELPFFVLTAIVLLSIISVFYRIKSNWRNLFIYGIILTFITHLIWAINDPVIGNKIQIISSPGVHVYFILLYGIIFSLGNLFRKSELKEDFSLIISTFLISFGFFGLFLLLTLMGFKDTLALSNLIASIVYLLLSVLFWNNEKSKYSTFFYAIVGYSALSIAIIAQFTKPDFFIWLCWQSLLVISTAIWFRSKIIIIANFIIYLIILIAFLVMAGSVNAISLSFGIVALFSARILNWQKNKLELKTELMRNSYLTVAFFVFPYALYKSIPGDFVILSWLGVGVLYYLLSVVLKNKKYRWMALFTFILTVIYILIIGIIQLEPVLRIVSFFVLGIVLIITSIAYTKMRSKNLNKTAEQKSG